jgi:hypothetical protein
MSVKRIVASSRSDDRRDRKTGTDLAVSIPATAMATADPVKDERFEEAGRVTPDR